MMVGVGSWVAHNWAVAVRVDGLMGVSFSRISQKGGRVRKNNGCEGSHSFANMFSILFINKLRFSMIRYLYIMISTN